MGDISRLADGVIAWLGPELGDSSKALEVNWPLLVPRFRLTGRHKA